MQIFNFDFAKLSTFLGSIHKKPYQFFGILIPRLFQYISPIKFWDAFSPFNKRRLKFSLKLKNDFLISYHFLFWKKLDSKPILHAVSFLWFSNKLFSKTQLLDSCNETITVKSQSNWDLTRIESPTYVYNITFSRIARDSLFFVCNKKLSD